MPTTTHRAARHARQTFPILIVAVLAGLAIAAGRADGHAGRAAAVDLEDATIASLISDQRSNTRTARAIAEQYLARIDAIDRHGPSLRSVMSARRIEQHAGCGGRLSERDGAGRQRVRATGRDLVHWPGVEG